MIRFGLVGLGKRTIEDHLPVMLEHPEVEVVCACDANGAAVEHWSRQLAIPGYSDLSAMLNAHAGKLDAVLLAVLHHAAGIACMNARVAVFKEKPLALNLTEGLEMAAITAFGNTPMMITMQRRHHTSYRAAKAWLPSGGAVRHALFEYTLATSQPASGWRGSRQQAGGGALIDMGYHAIDVALWYFGMPARVICQHQKPTTPDEVENEVNLWLEYANGVVVELFISRTNGPKREKLTVQQEQGLLEVTRGLTTFTPRDGSKPRVAAQDAGWDRALQRQLDTFVSVLSGEATNVSFSASAHCNHMSIIEAAYASARTGSAVVPKHFV